MTRRSREETLIAALLLLATVACGPADQGPLGGPYGGTSVPPPPTEGNSGSSSTPAAETGDGAAPAPATGDAGSGGHASADAGAAGSVEAGGAVPTWTALYAHYLATGTEGNCQGCHGSQMGSASAAYSFLQGKGYISGASSSLVKSDSCHASSNEAPMLSIGGTVYPTAHEPNDCQGVNVTGATVVITDANGKAASLTVDSVGNFQSSSTIATPYTATVSYNGNTLSMVTAQTSGDCNSCHDVTGENGAPGRIMLP